MRPGESSTTCIVRRVKNPSHAPLCCEGKAVRGVAPSILRFNRLHWRPLPEGSWQLDVLIEEEKGIFTKIQLLGEDGVPGRPWSSFVTEVSQSSSATCRRCQIHSAQLPMSFTSGASVLTRIWCSV